MPIPNPRISLSGWLNGLGKDRELVGYVVVFGSDRDLLICNPGSKPDRLGFPTAGRSF